MSEYEFDPAELLRALVDARVDFVVIGGYPAIRHREVARFTEDLDVIAAPERALRREFGPTERNAAGFLQPGVEVMVDSQ